LLPPEAFRLVFEHGKAFDETKSDVFSLGALMFYCFFDCLPWNLTTSEKDCMYKHIVSLNFDELFKIKRLRSIIDKRKLEKDWNKLPEFLLLICNMLLNDPI